MKELILHIGMHKTGTTSLQAFFARNAKRLARQGIAVPYFESYAPANRNRNGHFLLVGARFVSFPETKTNEEFAKFKRNYKTFVDAAKGADKVLLSDERFWLEGSMSNAFWIELKRLVEEAGIERIRAYVYLRRQDDFALSFWRQTIKIQRKDSFAEYLRRESTMEALDYYRWLKEAEQVLGEGNVNVHVFDRNAFVGGDLYHDFCDFTGIAWKDDFVIPPAERNPSLTYTVSEIKRWANQNRLYYKNAQKSNVLRMPAIHVSEANPDSHDTSLYSAELYKEMRDRYLPINAAVARDYLNGQGGLLVNWSEFDKQEWEPQLVPMLEATVQMFAEAMTQQDLEIQEQRATIKEQAKRLDKQEKLLTKLQQDLEYERAVRESTLSSRAKRGVRAVVKKVKR